MLDFFHKNFMFVWLGMLGVFIAILTVMKHSRHKVAIYRIGIVFAFLMIATFMSMVEESFLDALPVYVFCLIFAFVSIWGIQFCPECGTPNRKVTMLTRASCCTKCGKPLSKKKES